MNLNKISTETIAFTQNLGSHLLQKQKELTQEDIAHKGVHDLVTTLDKFSENQLVNFLSQLIPNSGFIAEEGTSEKVGTDYNWIIDPIDGTTNFVHGLPCFAISIALQYKGNTVFGLVHEPNLNESFYALKQQGSFLNGKRIGVSKTNLLNNALIATGFPYTDFGLTDVYLQLFKHLMENSRGLRRLGSAATDLAYVAAGRFDAFYEYNLSPWDVAAGAFIVEEANGIVSEFNGGKNYIFNKTILSSNSFIYNELKSIINQYFKV